MSDANDRSADYKEAALQVGKGIALGLLPFVGQAIDAWDTITSAIELYKAKAADDVDEARFDFLLAVIGWIPGPGDGVKKSLRVVNKDPERFAPVLFDLLRFVLKECGIDASPEDLLSKVFDTARLKATLAEVQKGVEDATAFKELPEWSQRAIKVTLSQAGASLPVFVGIAEKKLLKWKKLQRNSSAHEPGHGKAQKPPPKAKDKAVAHQGPSAGTAGSVNGSTSVQIARQAVPALLQAATGICGEHIADYICADTFGWGHAWHQHDAGGAGKWEGGDPSNERVGKLSHGGSPKAHHILYKLSDGPNGTGIDAVWHAEGHNNGRKYAVVEAKASRNEDAPKFHRRPDSSRQPSVRGTLGVVIKDELPIRSPEEIIEPIEGDTNGSPSAVQKTGGGKRAGGGAGKAAGGSGKRAGGQPNAAKADPAGRITEIHVQMSHEWIEANIKKAVDEVKVLNDFKRLSTGAYSRHLFYSPLYHLSGSPKAHMIARDKGLQEAEHAKHDAFHYDESQVRAAVNARKAKLRVKYGEHIAGLKEEK